jgi:hypothetical protein
MLFRNHHTHLIIRILTLLLLLPSFLPNISAHPLTSSGSNNATLNTTNNATKGISSENAIAGCNSDEDCGLCMFNLLPFESCGLLTVAPDRSLLLLH